MLKIKTVKIGLKIAQIAYLAAHGGGFLKTLPPEVEMSVTFYVPYHSVMKEHGLLSLCHTDILRQSFANVSCILRNSSVNHLVTLCHSDIVDNTSSSEPCPKVHSQYLVSS